IAEYLLHPEQNRVVAEAQLMDISPVRLSILDVIVPHLQTLGSGKASLVKTGINTAKSRAEGAREVVELGEAQALFQGCHVGSGARERTATEHHSIACFQVLQPETSQ